MTAPHTLEGWAAREATKGHTGRFVATITAPGKAKLTTAVFFNPEWLSQDGFADTMTTRLNQAIHDVLAEHGGDWPDEGEA